MENAKGQHIGKVRGRQTEEGWIQDAINGCWKYIPEEAPFTLFSDVTEKAGATNKGLCALQFLHCILESRNSSTSQKTELYQRVPESITCASSCLVHITELKQSCWPELLRDVKLPSCLYVRMKGQLLVHLLSGTEDHMILLIPAKQVWAQPTMLDRRALPYAGPQVTCQHSS